MNKTQVKLDAIRKLLEMSEEKSSEWKPLTEGPLPKVFLCYNTTYGVQQVCRMQNGKPHLTWNSNPLYDLSLDNYYWKPLDAPVGYKVGSFHE